MGSDMPEKFRQIFQEIRSGEFARGFQAERQAGYPQLSQAEAMSLGEHPMGAAEHSLRSLLKGAV